MTDAPDPTPDVPPGWSAEQPPPYHGGAGASWVSPGGQERPGASLDPGSPGSPGSPDGPGGPGGPGPQGPPHGAPPYGPPHGHGPGPYGPGGQQYGGHQYGPYGFHPPPQAPRPGIIPLRPLALGDILDGSIKLIRANPKATLGLSAIVAAITTLPVTVGQAILLQDYGTALSGESETVETLPFGEVAQLIGTLISLVITFFATTVLTGILTRVLGRAVFGGRITAGEAWRLARARVPALLGLVLLQGLILLAPALVAIMAFVSLAMAGSLDDLGGSDVGALLLLFLLFVLLYVPYVLFFQTKLALAAPSVVLEGLGATDAMRRSWRLVKGDSWRVLGIVLLTGLIVGVVSGVLSFPFSLAGTLLGFFGGGSAASAIIGALLVSVGGILTSMITYPFQAGVNGLLYADRRMRAEAFDLVLRTAAARNQEQGWVHAGVDDLWHPSYAAASAPADPGAGAPPYQDPYQGPRP
ncbi:glycerophosphoryl diester phosphodiesterase membrane domain-containing protein [Sphaerimonospora mesophila]|uniref:glycerophosphoryl diester phosphodiesterase membrane domain-containing protein n=1 Tax=Sphaerimonospora mesophila TaxID=37483 RepID=UPI0006E3383E